MVVAESTTNGLANAGTALVVCLLLSQLPAVFKVFKGQKPIEELSPLPTLFQGGNFVAWTVYGFVTSNINIWLVNLIGTCFSAFYVSVFLYYLRGPQRERFMQYLAGLLGLFNIYFIPVLIATPSKTSVAGMGDDSRQLALSLFAIAFNVLMYAAPLSAIRDAVRLKDPNRIPLLLTLAGTGCSLLWGSYGLLLPQWAVFGPNVAGLILNVIQLVAAASLMCGRAGKGGAAAGRRPSVEPLKGAYGESSSLTRRAMKPGAGAGHGDEEAGGDERGEEGAGASRLSAASSGSGSEKEDEEASFVTRV